MPFVRAIATGPGRMGRLASNNKCSRAAPAPQYYRRRGRFCGQLMRPNLLDFMMDIPDLHTTVEAHFPSTQDFFQLTATRRIPVQITEETDSFKLLAELPGVPKEDISIEIEGEKLTISVLSSSKASGEAPDDSTTGEKETTEGQQRKKLESSTGNDEAGSGVEVTEKEAQVVDEDRSCRDSTKYEARVFKLPDNVDVEAVNASCTDGLLTLSVPKLAASLPTRRSITIE